MTTSKILGTDIFYKHVKVWEDLGVPEKEIHEGIAYPYLSFGNIHAYQQQRIEKSVRENYSTYIFELLNFLYRGIK